MCDCALTGFPSTGARRAAPGSALPRGPGRVDAEEGAALHSRAGSSTSTDVQVEEGGDAKQGSGVRELKAHTTAPSGQLIH